MTTPFENEVSSIRELSEYEFAVLVDALDGVTPLGEFFTESQESECPAWLKAWFDSLASEVLYSTDSGDAMGICCFGLVWDSKSNECWTYGATVEPACPIAEVKSGRSSLTSATVWSHVREDLIGLGLPVIWCNSWFNHLLVKREFLEPFLRDALNEAGLERMDGGQGLPLGEWLDAIYGQVE